MDQRNNQKTGQQMDQKNAGMTNGKHLNQKKSGHPKKVGEAVEKIGAAIGNAGATSLGKKIHDAGEGMEKSQSKSKHPNDVTI